jgi:hypothetical protein
MDLVYISKSGCKPVLKPQKLVGYESQDSPQHTGGVTVGISVFLGPYEKRILLLLDRVEPPKSPEIRK